ncbi:MAG: arsenate reductase ArsC [Candidatus Omnitrophica bacterium]|nr:arsenate reductase ArsC [Candidatus Omnitrophota bacterium]
MNNLKVLFVCIHNSARSQMAEEILRKIGGDRFDVESAGIEPGQLNPIVVDSLKEDGIDIAGKKTKAVSDLLKAGKSYDYVITVCDETSAERCPVFPGNAKRIHWGFIDPSKFTGTYEEKLSKIRDVKAQINQRIAQWVKEFS